MALGTYIAERMLANGDTQKQIAAQCGISESYLSDIIRGNRMPTDADLLRKLAAALWINSDVLFFHAGVLAPDMYAEPASEYAICEAYAAMRRKLRKVTVKEAELAAAIAAEKREYSARRASDEGEGA